MILKNSIICNYCQEEIISKHVHDYVTCKCGKSSVDGGSFYQKRSGNSYTDTSIIDDGKFKTRRQYLKWGNNYDENMIRLPETIWIPIKDMGTEHIKSVLGGGNWSIDPIFKETFERELEYRGTKGIADFILNL